MPKFTTRDITVISLFAALTAVCSWITVPVFSVPYTLQFFAISLTLCLLGGKRGTISVLIYVVLGAIGIPVFSGFKGGPSAIFGLTGGYIMGFVFSALIYWLITSLIKKESIFVTVAALLASLATCYAFGTAWFMALYIRNTGTITLGKVLMMCVVPYIVPDLAKTALAIAISKPLKKALKI